MASDTVQIVVPKEVCRNFSIGAAAKISGKWVKSIGDQQDKEILADEFTVLHPNQFKVSFNILFLKILFLASQRTIQ